MSGTDISRSRRFSSQLNPLLGFQGKASTNYAWRLFCAWTQPLINGEGCPYPLGNRLGLRIVAGPPREAHDTHLGSILPEVAPGSGGIDAVEVSDIEGQNLVAAGQELALLR